MTTSSFHYASTSLEETARLGQAIAAAARARLVIGLSGHLGAGKTALVRAIATALDVPAEAISSPTYVLVHEYAGRLPVFHFDTYRLDNPAQFAALGVEEYFEGDGICLVEWADRVCDVLPEDRLDIRVTSTSESRRQFELIARGERSNRVLERIQAGVAN
jgi:tRNA threonylcarbamoyladenosine biosynthesis protein TsaE